MSLSHKHAEALGWKRIDPKPWSKTSARWEHTSGWQLDHCAHPTANYPWALYDPTGRMHLQGSTTGNPHFGNAWHDCLEAMAFVVKWGGWSIHNMNRIEREAPTQIRRRAA